MSYNKRCDACQHLSACLVWQCVLMPTLRIKRHFFEVAIQLSSIQRYGFSLYGQNKIGKKTNNQHCLCGNKKKFVSLPYDIANSIIILPMD